MVHYLLAPEYGTSPLWTVVDGVRDAFPCGGLPVAGDIRVRVTAWDQEYQATLNEEYPPDSTFGSESARMLWEAKGVHLGIELARGLGAGSVVAIGLPSWGVALTIGK